MKINKKCKGCGQYLSTDFNDITYVEKITEKTVYCKRCFQLINYKIIDNSKINNQQIQNELLKLDLKNNAVIMVVDLFDLHNSLIKEIALKDVDIVINKLSALPTKFKVKITLEKIKNILKKHNFFYKNIILYDAVNKKNLRPIFELIKNNHQQKLKTYIIGKTNVGKSSLINALLNLNKQQSELLSVSPYSNTTISFNKIILGKSVVIDTPGFINEQAIINYIEFSDINKINSTSKFVCSTYLIKKNTQVFFIEKLFYIYPISKNENGVISVYKKQNLKIHKIKKDNIDITINNNNLDLVGYKKEFNLFSKKEINLDSRKKYNLFINGIALISLKNINKITIGYSKFIDIQITDEALI